MSGGGDVYEYQRELTARLEQAMRERDEARAEVERLRGLVPELPPRPPDGAGPPRYGIRHNGPTQPLAVPMADGYWTPWHLTEAALRIVAEQQREADRKAFSMWLREVYATGFPHDTPEVLADAVDAGEVTLPLVMEGKTDGGSP